jgi:hypothetical protein
MFNRRLIQVGLILLVGSLLVCGGSLAIRGVQNRMVVRSLLKFEGASVYSTYGEYRYTPPPSFAGLVWRGGQRVDGHMVFGEPSHLERPLVPIFGQHAFTNIYAVYWESAAADRDLLVLAQVPDLRELHLSVSQITDSGIPRLVRLRQLTVLDLSSTRITGAGVQQLAGCQNLRELDLSNTELGDAAADQLHQALPNCLIFR